MAKDKEMRKWACTMDGEKWVYALVKGNGYRDALAEVYREKDGRHYWRLLGLRAQCWNGYAPSREVAMRAAHMALQMHSKGQGGQHE